MNKEDPYRDQAERLRKKIERKQETDSKIEEDKLPPRSRIHREKRKKNKWKLKYPVIRLLALIFILLPITIFSMYSYMNSKGPGKAEKTGINQSGYETVGYEKDKGTVVEVRDHNTETVESPSNTEKKSDVKIQGTKSSSTDGKEAKGSVNSSEEEKQSNTDGKSPADKKEKQDKQKQTINDGIVYHTVQPNETIYRIAMKYYKSQSGIEIIKKANNLNSNEIQAGQVLAIPPN